MARTPLSRVLFMSTRVLRAVLALAIAGASSLAAQSVEPGDLILVERPKGDVACPTVCHSDILVQSPPGSAGLDIGSQRDGAPIQIFEGIDGTSWFAHSPRRGGSFVEGLINSEGMPVREGVAPVLFAGTTDARITAAIMGADGRVWIGVETSGGTTLFRRRPAGQIASELRNIGPIRSLQLAPDQCQLYWLSGADLMSYDYCFRFGPNKVRTFSEPKHQLVLLPDGGYFVTGSGPVLQFNALGQQIRSFDIAESTGRAESLALTPDASGYWVATTDGIIRRFDSFRNQAQETVYVFGVGVAYVAVRRGWNSALDGPVPVRDLLVASVGGTAIDLRWSHLARKASGYEIEVWTESSGWTRVAIVEPDDHARVSGLMPATSYRFRIRTVTPWGTSAWSNIVDVTTESEPVPPVRFRRGVRPPG